MKEENNILLVGSINYMTMKYDADGSPLLSIILKVSNYEDSIIEEKIYKNRGVENQSFYDLSIIDEKALAYSRILKEGNFIKIEGRMINSNSYYEERKEMFDKTIIVEKMDIIFGERITDKDIMLEKFDSIFGRR